MTCHKNGPHRYPSFGEEQHIMAARSFLDPLGVSSVGDFANHVTQISFGKALSAMRGRTLGGSKPETTLE